MRLIREITQEPRQKHTVPIDGYDPVVLILEYKESQSGWFMSLSWGESFAINNMRVQTAENILRQWRNVLPFGIMVLTKNKQDPMLIDDFESANAELFFMTQDEVTLVEADFYA